MRILSLESYLDGGTLQIETDQGVYWVNRRLQKPNVGELYSSYPLDDNSNHIPDEGHVIRKQIHQALQSFTHPDRILREWNMKTVMEFALPPSLHPDQVKINDIRAAHPKAWQILQAIKSVNSIPAMQWDTMWEKDLLTLIKIKDVLDS